MFSQVKAQGAPFKVLRTNSPPARLFIDEKENCVKRSSVLDYTVIIFIIIIIIMIIFI